jgi:2',3'-cyclic-nucleotide 2'-phosphodiesterase (5'-nucleotidase family)
MTAFTKILSIILTTALIYAGSLFSQTTITLIHVNDTHSQLDGTGSRDVNLNPSIGGISRAATIIGTLKASEPNPILLHGGDFSGGDFFFNKYYGVPELQILTSLGFDAMTIGNHEFDLGPSTLDMVFDEAFSQASFPVVSANLDLTGYPDLSDYISPYTIKTVSGIKVGIFGMTIPAPLSNPSPVVIKENISEIAYATVQELQAQGCEVIIMLSHLGFDIDCAVAANVPGINFVVGAHDHLAFAQPKAIPSPGGITYIVQAGSSYENVGKLNFTFNNGVISSVNYDLIPVTSNVPSVPEIEAVISYLKHGIEQQYGNVYSEKLGFATKDIETFPGKNNKGWKDSPIGNFVTDAYRNATKTTIAITADGLISGKLYKGPLVGTDIFRVASYGYNTENGLGFNIMTCNISGIELIKGLETSLAMLGVDNDFFVQVSGFEFRYNPSNPPGERVILSSIRINGHLIVPDEKYSLTLNEGLLGILMSMGIQVEDIATAGITEYDALKNFVSFLRNFKYSTEGRITENEGKDDVNNIEENTLPSKFQLYQNYPNPFNPATTIKYEIPVSSVVTIKIFNSLGQEAATLVNELQQSGMHQVNWNASALSSGVYFYRLTVRQTGSSTGKFSETKRMILVK